MTRLATIASLWSMASHPSARRPWTLARKIKAVADAGFDGFAAVLTPEHRRLADRHALPELIGLIISAEPEDFPRLLAAQKEGGAQLVNIQLGLHETPPRLAVRQWLALEKAAEKHGLTVSLETHRGTCTETPEKTLEIAARYHELTGGRLLRLTLDFSHHAIVKHLAPEAFAERLLTRPDLVRHSNLCHFRPFNGHHVQVPVTGPGGRLTREVRDYLSFARQIMRVWKTLPPQHSDGDGKRTLYACPEMGPVGGYNITGLPPAWPDALRLRSELIRAWSSV